MEEMQSFFKDLATTTKPATQPSQKLANTALRSASELLKKFVEKREQQQNNKPPPLPARPSPTPPNQARTAGDKVDPAIESVLDSVENASVVSSQTLVNEEEANSTDSFVQVSVPEEGATEKDTSDNTKPATIDDATSIAETSPEHKAKLIAESLEHSDRKGTDQQDVEEIIGFILEHLMRAIRSSGPMPGKPELQADIITDNFFPLIVNYTDKTKDSGGVQESRAEVTTDRWINAFPHPKNGVSSTIQAALHRSFDVQTVDGQTEDENILSRYSAIRRLSPIIHIRIQRANATRAGASKNKNPVVLNDTLFLDPFMDTKDDSKLGIARRAGWALGGHDADDDEMEVDEVPKTTANTQDQDATPMDVDTEFTEWEMVDSEEAIVGTVGTISNRAFSLPRKRKFEEGQTTVTNVSPSTAKRPDMASSMTNEAAGITPSLSKGFLPDVETNVETVTKMDESLQVHKYRLHAVICHSGGTAAGHYWVWIRDFERDVWIKFNDDRITVDTREPQAVLDELNKGGDPCYLAYVRDEGKENLVGIPQRAMPDPNAADLSGTDVEMQTIEGISPTKANAPFSGLSSADAEPRPYDLL
jgi:ubiquitin carboxyl-terminal hydrolase 25